ELVLTPAFRAELLGPYRYSLSPALVHLDVAGDAVIDPLDHASGGTQASVSSCAPLVRLSAAVLHGSNLTLTGRNSAVPFPLGVQNRLETPEVFEQTWSVVVSN